MPHPNTSRRFLLPWYWTDELAETLGRINKTPPQSSTTQPIGIRRAEPTLEEAAVALAEDGELPLAV